jgi:4-hydroxy-tetrahydrodipicolinate reductase
MGRAIDAEAVARGHARAATFDSSSPAITGGLLAGAEVAFEFTRPSCAEANVIALLRTGVPVVCGTTGWQPAEALDEALRESGAALMLAPNFSIGVNLFFRLARRAGRLLGGVGMHQPFIREAHHRGKRDAPSGTASRLAEILLEEDSRLREVRTGNPSGLLPPEVLQISSLRVGSEPGTHTVGFDGEHDRITLQHQARSRAAFARGAVVAAEWIRGRQGRHGFDEVLDEMLERGRREAPERRPSDEEA